MRIDSSVKDQTLKYLDREIELHKKQNEELKKMLWTYVGVSLLFLVLMTIIIICLIRSGDKNKIIEDKIVYVRNEDKKVKL